MFANRLARLAAILLASSALPAPTALAQTCGGLEIFPLYNGTTPFTVGGVSGDGLTMCGSRGPSGLFEAFTYTEAGGIVFLGTLGGTASRALATSFDGSVVVGEARDSGGTTRPFRYTAAGGMEELTTSSGGSVWGWARDASADGSVVIGFELGLSGKPWRWTAATGLEFLGLPNGSTYVGAANGVSADGTIIVGQVVSGFVARAARWTAATGAVVLGPLPNGASSASFANGISADGETIVGEYLAGPGSKPFIWTAATGMFDPYPQQTGNSAWFSAVNGDGTLAIGTELLQSGVRVPILWAPEVGVVRLDSLSFNSISLEAISDFTGLTVGATSQAPNAGIMTMLQLSPLGATHCAESPVNGTGCFGRLSVEGSATIADDDLTLRARLVPPGAVGLFAMGDAQAVVPSPGNNIGTLCLGGSIGRFAGPGQIKVANAAGEFSLAVDLADLPSPTGSFAAQVGQTVFFQAWYREGGVASPPNFTDAVALTFR